MNTIPEIIKLLAQDVRLLKSLPKNFEWHAETSTFGVQVVESVDDHNPSMLFSLKTQLKSEVSKSVFLKEAEDEAQIGGKLPSGELSWSEKVYEF